MTEPVAHFEIGNCAVGSCPLQIDLGCAHPELAGTEYAEVGGLVNALDLEGWDRPPNVCPLRKGGVLITLHASAASKPARAPREVLIDGAVEERAPSMRDL